MTAPWRKAIRDFRNERARTVMVVLAIAAGIAAFSTVMSSYAILVRELDRGYLETNPASATLWTDKVDQQLLADVRARTPVSDAEARRTVRARVKAGPMAWKTLMLFVVADYGDIRVSVLKPQSGAWPPKRGELLIERDAFQVAKTKVGERVLVRTSDGTQRELRVAGSVHDVGQAQARMENAVYGYVTLETLADLGEEPYLDELKILAATNRYDEAHVRRVADEVRSYVESRGHAVRRMDVPRPGKHPHADLMGMLLLSMSSFGMFILLLSGIVVVNLLTALMASQVRQIGVMKAVGGTRAQIARIYFVQALLLGIAAVAVAIPLGMWGTRLLCRQQARFLNFDIASFSVPLWVYLLDALVGIVVPLLAAAWPVWKGSGVSVREALADYGVSANRFGIGAFDRLLTNVGGLARPTLLAIRNSFRRRTRMVLTVITLAAGGLFFMAALNVRASLIRTLDGLFGQRNYDLSVSFASMVELDALARAARATPGIARSEGWIASEGSIGGGHVVVLAVPSDTKMLSPRISAGRWFQKGDVEVLVVNSALASRDSRIRLGNVVDLGQVSGKVIGISREPFAPPVAYVLRKPGRVNNLKLDLLQTDPDSINRVKAALEKNLEREGLRAVASQSNADSRIGFDEHMLMLYVFLMVVAAVIVLVGGLGLMTTMSLNVLERRREMGVLRAIGATPSAVWLIVAAEGAVIGLMSWALAAAAAWPVSRFTGSVLIGRMSRGGLDFVFEPAGLLIWLAAAIGLSVIASFLPAWHASRGAVAEALMYE